jgi:glycosyltransferase involved in cell wall biosynthesis
LKKKPWLWLLVPCFNLSMFWNAARLVSMHSIDVIHAHWIRPQGLVAVLCAKLLRKDLRVVITSHGADIFGLRFGGKLKRWVLNRARALTVVSAAMEAEVRRLGVRDGLPVRVIPMGIDTFLFHPEKKSESLRTEYSICGPFLLFVGRLTEKKGVKYLLDALPLIVEQHPSAKLLIIGDGEEREDLIRQASALGIAEHNLLFLGPMSNRQLAKFYATADVFVGPSVTTAGGDREGFGLVFAEALASGCTVVASDQPAISDLVLPGKTGLVVRQRDSDEIAQAALCLLGNPTLMNRLRKDGRSYVSQNFEWDRIAKSYSHLLKAEAERRD